MPPRPRFTVPLPDGRSLVLGERTLVMGIVNVTPDSFADGGLRFDPEKAVADALEMIADGADIIDVGGESTRPGAAPVPEAEERRRVLPVVAALAGRAGVPISIDTYKAGVARDALHHGATIVNDISGLQFDPALGDVVARSGAAVVLMHNRGRSREMYQAATYVDVAGEVRRELEAAMERAAAYGIAREQIILDPGIGFAKRAEHSFEVLARLHDLASLGRPLLSGPSRKSFLTQALGDRPAAARDWGTAAAVTASVLSGAHIVRVHDVKAMADVVRVADGILNARPR